MIKTFATILVLILMLMGCQGCFIPGIGKQKINLSLAEMSAPEPTKTAVIVPLWGNVSEQWAIDIEKALKNPKNDLVVLKIESPGGSVGETIALLRKILKYQHRYDNKPIQIYSSWLLASGAYWIAAAFKPIIVSPLSYSGSIGVYIERKDFSEYYEKKGLKFNLIASDSAKIVGHFSVPMSDKERATLQQSVNYIYIKFLNHIWDHRSSQLLVSYAMVNFPFSSIFDTVAAKMQFQLVANGAIHNSHIARRYGLVDQVLFFDKFIENLHIDGYATVLLNGKVIIDFLPMTKKDWKEQTKVKTYIRHHLQLEHK